jgi:hypothetical protein
MRYWGLSNVDYANPSNQPVDMLLFSLVLQVVKMFWWYNIFAARCMRVSEASAFVSSMDFQGLLFWGTIYVAMINL